MLAAEKKIIDDGYVDMKRAMSIYERCGFDGTIIPDHTPRLDAADFWETGIFGSWRHQELSNTKNFLEKYADECASNPQFEIFQRKTIGNCKTSLGQNATDEFRRVYQLSHRPVDLAKLWLSRLGLLPVLFRFMDRRKQLSGTMQGQGMKR